jgi:tRNA uridine 5-carbamoylmethylation protein Kti12
MKTAIILRGLPGSGKSTIGALLVQSLHEDVGIPPNSTAIHSTDAYFYNEAGDYIFDPSKLGEYHNLNFRKFNEACSHGVPLVICDNTNTQHWEFERYAEAAEGHGYQVHIVTVGTFDVDECFERGRHGVPKESIQAMKDRWEL